MNISDMHSQEVMNLGNVKVQKLWTFPNVQLWEV